MPPPGSTVMKGVNHAMTASNQCNDNSILRNAIAEIALHLSDISVACHSISYELKQIRHALRCTSGGAGERTLPRSRSK
jgi:hypothetical protein